MEAHLSPVSRVFTRNQVSLQHLCDWLQLLRPQPPPRENPGIVYKSHQQDKLILPNRLTGIAWPKASGMQKHSYQTEESKISEQTFLWNVQGLGNPNLLT